MNPIIPNRFWILHFVIANTKYKISYSNFKLHFVNFFLNGLKGDNKEKSIFLRCNMELDQENNEKIVWHEFVFNDFLKVLFVYTWKTVTIYLKLWQSCGFHNFYV